MLGMLRASEERHRKQNQRNAIISIGERVAILEGPNVGANGLVVDLDYINNLALFEPTASPTGTPDADATHHQDCVSGESADDESRRIKLRRWLKMNHLAPAALLGTES